MKDSVKQWYILSFWCVSSFPGFSSCPVCTLFADFSLIALCGLLLTPVNSGPATRVGIGCFQQSSTSRLSERIFKLFWGVFTDHHQLSYCVIFSVTSFPLDCSVLFVSSFKSFNLTGLSSEVSSVGEDSGPSGLDWSLPDGTGFFLDSFWDSKAYKITIAKY